MAEHVMRFAYYKNLEAVSTQPKDKIDWIKKDDRPEKYITSGKSYIFQTKEAFESFKAPEKCPEDEWQQVEEKHPHKKYKKRGFDDLEEFSDFPDHDKPDEDFTVKSKKIRSGFIEILSQKGIDLSFRYAKKPKKKKPKKPKINPRKRQFKDLAPLEDDKDNIAEPKPRKRRKKKKGENKDPKKKVERLARNF